MIWFDIMAVTISTNFGSRIIASHLNSRDHWNQLHQTFYAQIDPALQRCCPRRLAACRSGPLQNRELQGRGRWARTSVREIGRRLHRDPPIISRLYSADAADRDQTKEKRLVETTSPIKQYERPKSQRVLLDTPTVACMAEVVNRTRLIALKHDRGRNPALRG